MSLDKMIKRPYEILSYNPGWVLEFEKIRDDIAQAFGDKALSIEHIGSTSVVGMSAKPLIDVLVIIEKYEPFVNEKESMVKMGYEWGENYIEPDSLLFYKTINGDQKNVNIHVCVNGSPKAVQFITTRDYLRAHPDRASEYSDLKLKLKQQYPNDYPAYRAGKESFLQETERLTKEWLSKN